jgi:hypothetical protein
VRLPFEMRLSALEFRRATELMPMVGESHLPSNKQKVGIDKIVGSKLSFRNGLASLHYGWRVCDRSRSYVIDLILGYII